MVIMSIFFQKKCAREEKDLALRTLNPSFQQYGQITPFIYYAFNRV